MQHCQEATRLPRQPQNEQIWVKTHSDRHIFIDGCLTQTLGLYAANFSLTTHLDARAVGTVRCGAAPLAVTAELHCPLKDSDCAAESSDQLWNKGDNPSTRGNNHVHEDNIQLNYQPVALCKYYDVSWLQFSRTAVNIMVFRGVKLKSKTFHLKDCGWIHEWETRYKTPEHHRFASTELAKIVQVRW